MPSSWVRRLAPWLPPALATVGIWFLSSLPNLRPPGPYFPHRDKVFHAVQFGLLGYLFARAAMRSWPRHHPRTVWFGVLLTSAIGLLDELHQAFVPGRDADVLDWLADTLGGVLGAWCRWGVYCWLEGSDAVRRSGQGAAERPRGGTER